MLKTVTMLILLAIGLCACAGTGTWVPVDPAIGSQEKSDRDMQYCVNYGERMGSGMAVLSLPVRNSYVENCMRGLGYRKIDENPEEKTTSQP